MLYVCYNAKQLSATICNKVVLFLLNYILHDIVKSLWNIFQFGLVYTLTHVHFCKWLKRLYRLFMTIQISTLGCDLNV